MKSHRTADAITDIQFKMPKNVWFRNGTMLKKFFFPFRILRELWSSTLPKISLHAVFLTIVDTLISLTISISWRTSFLFPPPPSSFCCSPIFQRHLYFTSLRLIQDCDVTFSFSLKTAAILSVFPQKMFLDRAKLQDVI